MPKNVETKSQGVTEEKFAHTPGPWEILEIPYRGNGKDLLTQQGGLPRICIEEMRDDGAPCLAEIGSPNVCGLSLDECRANARLIAAAPELLEACKVAFDYIDMMPATALNRDAYSVCQSAIAKAEGK